MLVHQGWTREWADATPMSYHLMTCMSSCKRGNVV